MEQDVDMTGKIEKLKRIVQTEGSAPKVDRGELPVSRNLIAKKQMAEQLMALGLSKESIARVLHLRLTGESSSETKL